jgi:hypothetical protein
MNSTDKLAIPAHVMARQVDGEMVILDLESGTYYGLDPVGARAWALLAAGHTLDETCAALLEEYEVEPERLARDIRALADALAAQGLVEPG